MSVVFSNVNFSYFRFKGFTLEFGNTFYVRIRIRLNVSGTLFYSPKMEIRGHIVCSLSVC